MLLHHVSHLSQPGRLEHGEASPLGWPSTFNIDGAMELSASMGPQAFVVILCLDIGTSLRQQKAFDVATDVATDVADVATDGLVVEP